MEVDISAFLSPRIIFLIVFIVLLIIFITVLYSANKKLKKRVMLKNQEEKKEDMLKERIINLKDSNGNPEKLLDSIDRLAKELFNESPQNSKNLDYSELISVFKKKNNELGVSFCKKMLGLLYAGEKATKQDINNLIKQLEIIASEIHPRLERIEAIPAPPVKQLKREQGISMPPPPSPLKFSKSAIEEYNKNLLNASEEQIRIEYKKMQMKFEQAYESAKKTNNRERLLELVEFRARIEMVLDEYSQDKRKIKELARELARANF